MSFLLKDFFQDWEKRARKKKATTPFNYGTQICNPTMYKKKKKITKKVLFQAPTQSCSGVSCVYSLNMGALVLYNCSWERLKLLHYPRYTFGLIVRVGPDSSKFYANK